MKTMPRVFLCAALSVFFSSASIADGISNNSSDTMTCGTNFISVGDSEDEVLRYCGEPSFREDNHWTYHKVQGSFVYVLTFGGGNVLSITTQAAD
jgi:hypothetical protein